MNIYDKFLECSPEYKGMGEAKETTISWPYYNFLKGIAHKYYELKAQQQEIQYDEEVVVKTAEELFGKVAEVKFYIIENDQHYSDFHLGKSFLRSTDKGWFDNIPKILIKSRRKIADPSTFPVDTLIQVKIDGIWLNRHFAKYEHNKVLYWGNGHTSKTTPVGVTDVASEWSLPEEESID
jgi:hypothetical protein